jgi:hypothetical protein
LIGWIIGGILFALAGLIVAYVVDCFFPKWKYELTWKEIDLAIGNLYKYGKNPSELCFRVGSRKVLIYRDERGNPEKGDAVRMAVRIPLEDWAEFYSRKDLSDLMHKFGGMGMYSQNRGPEAYLLFPRGGGEDCKEILRILFQKAVGGLRPDIYAQSVVISKKSIWIDHSA